MNSKQKWKVRLQRSLVQIEMALRNMKDEKATGPDNLPVEDLWKRLGRTGVNLLKDALNKVTDEEKVPDIIYAEKAF